MAQVLEYLPSNPEDFSSNSSTAKERERETSHGTINMYTFYVFVSV
jgi:hypothetical protein